MLGTIKGKDCDECLIKEVKNPEEEQTLNREGSGGSEGILNDKPNEDE